MDIYLERNMYIALGVLSNMSMTKSLIKIPTQATIGPIAAEMTLLLSF